MMDSNNRNGNTSSPAVRPEMQAYLDCLEQLRRQDEQDDKDFIQTTVDAVVNAVTTALETRRRNNHARRLEMLAPLLRAAEARIRESKVNLQTDQINGE